MPTHSVVRSGHGWGIFNWAVISSEVRYHNLIEQIDVGSSMAALSVYVDATAEAALGLVSSTFQIVQILVHLQFHLVCLLLALQVPDAVSQTLPCSNGI